ncbi:MAG: efflux RND transporter periplasmic adaptor subunit [Candidatus Paceibacterota bacterium]|jgi:HlyD family secretion protein
MKNIFTKVKSFILSNKWWAIAVSVVVVIILIIIFAKSKTTPIETVVVERHNIKEVVSTTGNVKPFSDVDLSFETTGRVSDISVSVGDRVYDSQYLASVSNGDLLAQVEQAKAGLKNAEANLSATMKGSTPEQIALQESQVEKTKIDLIESEKALNDTSIDSYTKSDDSIRNKIDQIFDNPRAQNVELKFNINNFQLKIDIEQGRANTEALLTSWDNSLTDQNISVDGKSKLAKDNLNTIKGFLDKVALAVNSLSTADSSLTQTSIDTYKSAVSTARTAISTAISALASSVNQYKISESALKIAENQLILTKSSATSEEISSKEALVDQAKSVLDNAYAQLAKSVIRSPINGIITSIPAKVGEVIQAGKTAISVISYGEYEVESFVAEADIAKIEIGDMASTTLDAYGSDTFFDTTVIKIDPAETTIDGVSTYKVTFKFVTKDDRIKSGMTANLDIITGQKESVLSVPTRSVYALDNKKFVNIVDPQNPKNITEREVKTGLRGVDGYIEILSGITDGEKVVASPSI